MKSNTDLNRDILRLAIPNIISNISVPLLGMVDTALVGHLEGLDYLGAVAVGSVIFSFIYWGFGFLRMGTTGLTAQAFGNVQDQDGTTLTLARALIAATGIATALLLLQFPIADASFYMIEGSAGVEHYARSYFHIRIFAAPATLSLFAFSGWFLGMQNARYAMYLSIFVNAINIIFSILFVKVFNLHSDGVAWGTVCAQYAGLVAAMLLYLYGYMGTATHLRIRLILKLDEIRRFAQVNFDIFIRTLCLVFAFTFFTAKSAEISDEILATNSILLQLWSLMAYAIDGFAFAAESLVGRFIGARKGSILIQVIKRSFLWAIIFGGLISLAYGLMGRQILGLFTDKPHILELAMSFIAWTIAAPLINSVCFLWDGVFIGATDGKALRNSMVFCTFVVFLPVYYLFLDSLGNHALWLAMTSFMVFRGITLTWYAIRHFPKWVAPDQGPF